MSDRFSGKTAVVTGTSSGIGRATAQLFARQGARVIAVDINAPFDESADQSIEHIRGDLTDSTLVEAIVSQAGHVDILANVAGIMDSFLPAGEVDDATWDLVMAVNLTAPMRLMRAVLPGMVERGSGAIVNVASEAALKGGCAGAAYTASKHGLIGLTKNTAFLYATKGIRVNAVAPGAVATGLQPAFRSALASERIPALLQASIPRLAQPDEIANCITWLASDEAANINGAVLAADGGWSAA